MLKAMLHAAAVAATALLAASDARADLLTGVTIGNRLVTFDSSAPNTLIFNQPITGLQLGEFILALDRRPADGLLYALGSNRLYTINPTTAAATQVGSDGSFSLSSGFFGMDVNPVSDFLRVTNNSTGQNLRIDPNTGNLIATDTPLSYAAGDAHAGTGPNVVGSAYTNNVTGATSTTLYGIDSALDILVTQSPENAGTLHTVGSLGFDTSDFVGFEISGASGTAFASLRQPGPSNFSQLYSINLGTGTATFLGNIGTSSSFNGPLAGLTGPVASTPEPSSLTLVGIGRLVGAWLARRQRLNRQDAKAAMD
jgi:Domain of unknown function (DUF4394)/PEP-CTERM motif